MALRRQDRRDRPAARCARDAIYAAKHFPLHPGSTKLTPYKVVSPTTINSGAFDTWLARGRVFALGEAHTVKSSRIVQADLARVAGEIAG
jgi:hypothetical protein